MKKCRLVLQIPLISLRERVTGNHQLSLLLLVSVITVLAVTPFAVFRLITGFTLVAAVDFLLVSVTAGTGLYAFVTGKVRIPALVISALLTVGLIVVTEFLGLDGTFWLFPVILFVFYLVSPIVGLVLTGAALGYFFLKSLWNPGSIFLSNVQMAIFLASGVTSGVFSFFFARQANKQREQLVQWATRDPLTGLYNRRTLDEELKIAIALRDRRGASSGLIILDLDNFKEINDQAGHAAGDTVLRDLAGLIASHTRAEDRAFRYGGDEFIVLCTDMDAEGLRRLAENLVSIIATSLSAKGIPVTASVGAAVLRDDDSAGTWNKRADRNLYLAKERGRNRAVVDTPKIKYP